MFDLVYLHPRHTPVLGGWVVPVGGGVTGANVIDRTDVVTRYRRDVAKGKGGEFGKV